MASTGDIIIEYDKETENYVISLLGGWVATFGKTEQTALEMLREATHLTIDTLIDLRIEDLLGATR